MKYKGYEVKQSPNNHIWITKDGNCISHVTCDVKKTDDELRETVDCILELRNSMGTYLEAKGISKCVDDFDVMDKEALEVLKKTTPEDEIPF